MSVGGDFEVLHKRTIDNWNRAKSNFDHIFEKFNKPFEGCDELDLSTLSVVRSKGHLKNIKPKIFGKSKLKSSISKGDATLKFRDSALGQSASTNTTVHDACITPTAKNRPDNKVLQPENRSSPCSSPDDIKPNITLLSVLTNDVLVSESEPSDAETISSTSSSDDDDNDNDDLLQDTSGSRTSRQRNCGSSQETASSGEDSGPSTSPWRTAASVRARRKILAENSSDFARTSNVSNFETTKDIASSDSAMVISSVEAKEKPCENTTPRQSRMEMKTMLTNPLQKESPTPFSSPGSWRCLKQVVSNAVNKAMTSQSPQKQSRRVCHRPQETNGSPYRDDPIRLHDGFGIKQTASPHSQNKKSVMSTDDKHNTTYTIPTDETRKGPRRILPLVIDGQVDDGSGSSTSLRGQGANAFSKLNQNNNSANNFRLQAKKYTKMAAFRHPNDMSFSVPPKSKFCVSSTVKNKMAIKDNINKGCSHRPESYGTSRECCLNHQDKRKDIRNYVDDTSNTASHDEEAEVIVPLRCEKTNTARSQVSTITQAHDNKHSFTTMYRWGLYSTPSTQGINPKDTLNTGNIPAYSREPVTSNKRCEMGQISKVRKNNSVGESNILISSNKSQEKQTHGNFSPACRSLPAQRKGYVTLTPDRRENQYLNEFTSPTRSNKFTLNRPAARNVSLLSQKSCGAQPSRISLYKSNQPCVASTVSPFTKGNRVNACTTQCRKSELSCTSDIESSDVDDVIREVSESDACFADCEESDSEGSTDCEIIEVPEKENTLIHIEDSCMEEETELNRSNHFGIVTSRRCEDTTNLQSGDLNDQQGVMHGVYRTSRKQSYDDMNEYALSLDDAQTQRSQRTDSLNQTENITSIYKSEEQKVWENFKKLVDSCVAHHRNESGDSGDFTLKVSVEPVPKTPSQITQRLPETPKRGTSVTTQGLTPSSSFAKLKNAASGDFPENYKPRPGANLITPVAEGLHRPSTPRTPGFQSPSSLFAKLKMHSAEKSKSGQKFQRSSEDITPKHVHLKKNISTQSMPFSPASEFAKLKMCSPSSMKPTQSIAAYRTDNDDHSNERTVFGDHRNLRTGMNPNVLSQIENLLPEDEQAQVVSITRLPGECMKDNHATNAPLNDNIFKRPQPRPPIALVPRPNSLKYNSRVTPPRQSKKRLFTEAAVCSTPTRKCGPSLDISFLSAIEEPTDTQAATYTFDEHQILASSTTRESTIQGDSKKASSMQKSNVSLISNNQNVRLAKSSLMIEKNTTKSEKYVNHNAVSRTEHPEKLFNVSHPNVDIQHDYLESQDSRDKLHENVKQVKNISAVDANATQHTKTIVIEESETDNDDDPLISVSMREPPTRTINGKTDKHKKKLKDEKPASKGNTMKIESCSSERMKYRTYGRKKKTFTYPEYMKNLSRDREETGRFNVERYLKSSVEAENSSPLHEISEDEDINLNLRKTKSTQRKIHESRSSIELDKSSFSRTKTGSHSPKSKRMLTARRSNSCEGSKQKNMNRSRSKNSEANKGNLSQKRARGIYSDFGSESEEDSNETVKYNNPKKRRRKAGVVDDDDCSSDGKIDGESKCLYGNVTISSKSCDVTTQGHNDDTGNADVSFCGGPGHCNKTFCFTCIV